MKKYNWLINKSEDYIEEHLSDKIVLKDIAKALNISEFHFHRIFSEHSNETLSQFITRIKMERSAIYLVVNQKITITEIALSYGYGEASSYNRAFRKHFSMSPTQFRIARKDKKI